MDSAFQKMVIDELCYSPSASQEDLCRNIPGWERGPVSRAAYNDDTPPSPRVDAAIRVNATDGVSAQGTLPAVDTSEGTSSEGGLLSGFMDSQESPQFASPSAVGTTQGPPSPADSFRGVYESDRSQSQEPPSSPIGPQLLEDLPGGSQTESPLSPNPFFSAEPITQALGFSPPPAAPTAIAEIPFKEAAELAGDHSSEGSRQRRSLSFGGPAVLPARAEREDGAQTLTPANELQETEEIVTMLEKNTQCTQPQGIEMVVKATLERSRVENPTLWLDEEQEQTEDVEKRVQHASSDVSESMHPLEATGYVAEVADRSMQAPREPGKARDSGFNILEKGVPFIQGSGPHTPRNAMVSGLESGFRTPGKGSTKARDSGPSIPGEGFWKGLESRFRVSGERLIEGRGSGLRIPRDKLLEGKQTVGILGERAIQLPCVEAVVAGVKASQTAGKARKVLLKARPLGRSMGSGLPGRHGPSEGTDAAAFDFLVEDDLQTARCHAEEACAAEEVARTREKSTAQTPGLQGQQIGGVGFGLRTDHFADENGCSEAHPLAPSSLERIAGEGGGRTAASYGSGGSLERGASQDAEVVTDRFGTSLEAGPGLGEAREAGASTGPLGRCDSGAERADSHSRGTEGEEVQEAQRTVTAGEQEAGTTGHPSWVIPADTQQVAFRAGSTERDPQGGQLAGDCRMGSGSESESAGRADADDPKAVSERESAPGGGVPADLGLDPQARRRAEGIGLRQEQPPDSTPGEHTREVPRGANQSAEESRRENGHEGSPTVTIPQSSGHPQGGAGRQRGAVADDVWSAQTGGQRKRRRLTPEELRRKYPQTVWEVVRYHSDDLEEGAREDVIALLDIAMKMGVKLPVPHSEALLWSS